MLIANNAKIDARNAEGRTPLMLAAAGGSTAVAEYLIANGATIAAADVNGRTALHSAAEVSILKYITTIYYLYYYSHFCCYCVLGSSNYSATATV